MFDNSSNGSVECGSWTNPSWRAPRPSTPIDAEASATARRALYDTALVNSARSSAYFRADIRVDRRFIVSGNSVFLFAGVQNATNRRNIAGYTWDRRNNQLQTQDQIRVFPIWSGSSHRGMTHMTSATTHNLRHG